MKNLILLILFMVFMLFIGCTLATNETIGGTTWQITYHLMTPISGGIYFEFRTDDTVSCDADKEDLFTSNASNTGTYTLDGNGNIELSFIPSYSIDSIHTITLSSIPSYTVYISGQYMYWYYKSLEVLRFKKQ